jgi:protein tyrosine phosphatase (PTP) superfamily phosphohydrolase (DUF442 family)
MPRHITATSGSVSFASVYFNLGPWIITSQPAYNPPLANVNPYASIAAAGIHSVLSVRDPAEVALPVNPFDLTEAQQCVLNNVSYTNVPLAHFGMPAGQPQSQTLAQPLFNLQAYNAASVINAATANFPWHTPILIHCSSGDRASAAFAVFLIAYDGWTPANAATFAQNSLALAAFVPFVQNYSKP